MINRIIAIALNSIRLAIRSRLVVCLLLILLVTIIGLPISIKGDGTFAGKATILLFYTLGLTVVILGASTMWSACSSISQEVAGRQIQLVAVKPVSALEIWLGKWLGILIMNAVLLLISSVTVYSLLMMEVRKAGLDERETKALYNEVLVGRRSIEPREESVHGKAHARIEHLVEAGKIPPELKNDETYFLEMEKRMKAATHVVGAGKTKQWIFDVPKSFNTKKAMAIRYRFSVSTRDRTPVSGMWKAGTIDSQANFTINSESAMDGIHLLYIPSDAITPGEPAVITFSNTETDKKNSAVFAQTNGIELMNKASSFAANYIRSIIVLFCHLALVAALGLTLGSIFSFPVATFCTCALIVLSLSVHYFTVLVGDDTHVVCHSHGHSHPEPTAWNELTTDFVKSIEKYIAPSMRYKPLDKLADGILVSSSFTVGAILLLGLLYPAIMAVISTFLIRTRELALPKGHT
ncbi:hypothetical protein BVX94_02175 [bacterium B17]|nr:hypothetical protein BVX94_02175 [bacterium B17]